MQDSNSAAFLPNANCHNCRIVAAEDNAALTALFQRHATTAYARYHRLTAVRNRDSSADVLEVLTFAPHWHLNTYQRGTERNSQLRADISLLAASRLDRPLARLAALARRSELVGAAAPSNGMSAYE